jgi:ligand-binding sensor domain-containing protein
VLFLNRCSPKNFQSLSKFIWRFFIINKISIFALLFLISISLSGQGEWKIFNKENSGLPSNSIRLVVQDRCGNYWIATTDSGLVKFDGKNWEVFNKRNSGLPHNYVYAIDFDKEDNLWIGTYGGGLAKFDGKKKWEVFNQSNSGLSDNWIYSLIIDKQSTIWIGTFTGGLVKFDGKNWVVYNKFNSPLTQNKVTYLFIDDNDLLWVGTAERMFWIKDTLWINEKEMNYNSVDDACYWITSDKKGKIIFSYKFGSIVIYENEQFTIYNESNSEMPYQGFYGIACDSNGVIWAGTFGQGILKFYDGKWEPIRSKNSKLSDDMIFNIYIDRKGNIWFSTYRGGISIFNEIKIIL